MEIAIIGGGAAGFMAAITAQKTDPASKVTIFERAQKVLAKVEITGGGRCNLTNSFAAITDMKQAYPRGDKFMKRLMKTFSYEDTYKWFEKHGVPLVTQEDECVFPKAQDAHAIIDCLVRQARELGITVCCKHRLTDICQKEDGSFELMFENASHRSFHRVIVSTGGSPHARALDYLARLGHKIEHPVPSLFTFATEDSFIEGLAGVSKEVNAKLLASDHSSLKIPLLEKQGLVGALLVTHWGFSGPVVLRLSAFAARILAQLDYKFSLKINWLAEEEILSSEEALSILQEEKQKHPRKELQNHCPFNLTKKLWNKLLERSGALPHLLWAELNKAQLHALAHTLTHSIFPIEGKATFKEEFVTAGGVSLKEIDFKSFRSKLFSTLYIGGEALDIDAVTGGYNFQNAWSSGYLIAEGVTSE